MIFTLLDENFVTVRVLDDFKSFIWTDRFCEYGDFELYRPFTQEWIQGIYPNMYVANDESDHLMIVENIKVEDTEDGEFVSITGRSLESILDRRIVWVQTDLSTTLVKAIQRLLNDSILNPSIKDRKISNFIYVPPTDSDILKIKIDKQWTGDSVYKAISELLAEEDLGFQIVVDNRKRFVMSILKSVDKSSYINFSKDMNNIFSSTYVNSYEDYKNVVLVAGEGQGADRKTRIVGSGSGLERRELYSNSSGIRSDQVSAATYLKMLDAKGQEELYAHRIMNEYEADADVDRYYKYRVDYNVGDIVIFENPYGESVTARIDEMIFSHDDEGSKAYPSFTIL